MDLETEDLRCEVTLPRKHNLLMVGLGFEPKLI